MPRLWLLSDPTRLPDPSAAIRRLPRGAAVVLRGAAPAVAARVARLCRARRIALLVAGDGRVALALGAGLHLPDRRPVRHLLPFLAARRGTRRPPWLSVAAHGRAGLARARRLRADAALLSPAFASDSHPGQPGLGPLRWAALARRGAVPAVALGGMTPRRARRLPRSWLAGWAAIGAWRGDVVSRPQCVRDVAFGRPSRLPANEA